jgi:hypothetical protein
LLHSSFNIDVRWSVPSLHIASILFYKYALCNPKKYLKMGSKPTSVENLTKKKKNEVGALITTAEALETQLLHYSHFQVKPGQILPLQSI